MATFRDLLKQTKAQIREIDTAEADELRRAGRSTAEVVRVRQIAMYVAHVALGITMKDVGRGFGRDRTTVAYACHTVEDLRDNEEYDRLVAMTEKVALAAFRNRIMG